MDWAEAIERNRAALLGIVASLFTMLGLAPGGSLPRMPLAVHRAILRLLTPAEAALRRLIVIAAWGLTPEPARSRSQSQTRRSRDKGRASPPPFLLVDPQKRAARPRRRRPVRAEPRLSYFDRDGRFVSSSSAPRPKARPEPDGCVGSQRLCRRLEALKRALADIPHQARRLARWRARQEAKQPPTPETAPVSPLRDGLPPGTRKRPQHEVDDVLAECHDLALYALSPDTS